MSEVESANSASHTSAYLRRLDQRMQDLSELFVRQQELIGRLDRDIREGFSILQRDVREMKSDMVLMENRIVSTMSADHHASARLNEHEARLDASEGRNPTL